MTDRDFERVQKAREKKARKLADWIKRNPKKASAFPSGDSGPIPAPEPWEPEKEVDSAPNV